MVRFYKFDISATSTMHLLFKKKNLLLETYWHLLVPQYIYDAEGFFLINLKLITSHALYLSLSLLSSIYNSIPLLLLLLLSLYFSLSLSLYIPTSYPHHLFPFIFYFSTSFSGSGDTSDSPISPDNFATKARAALNSLPSPPDKVRMCYLWSHRLQNSRQCLWICHTFISTFLPKVYSVSLIKFKLFSDLP